MNLNILEVGVHGKTEVRGQGPRGGRPGKEAGFGVVS